MFSATGPSAAARILRLVLAAVLSAPACGAAAQTARVPVDLELAFVVDASGSIDDEEFRLQRQGYADALANPRVLKAISGGFLRAVAVTYVEFAGSGCVWRRVGWTAIRDAADAKAFGDRVLAAPRERCPGGNAIGEAVAAAAESALGNGYDGTRKVIDVSGDGPDTVGAVPVEIARAAALAHGFTINGLVIERPSMPDLPEYYRSSIAGGPGSFVIEAENRRTFADAILKKMILEIAGRAVETARRDGHGQAPRSRQERRLPGTPRTEPDAPVETTGSSFRRRAPTR